MNIDEEHWTTMGRLDISFNVIDDGRGVVSREGPRTFSKELLRPTIPLKGDVWRSHASY